MSAGATETLAVEVLEGIQYHPQMTATAHEDHDTTHVRQGETIEVQVLADILLADTVITHEEILVQTTRNRGTTALPGPLTTIRQSTNDLEAGVLVMTDVGSALPQNVSAAGRPLLVPIVNQHPLVLPGPMALLTTEQHVLLL